MQRYNIFKRKIKNYFHLVIINDCSSEKYNLKKYRFKMIHKITFISLNQNWLVQKFILFATFSVQIGLIHEIKHPWFRNHELYWHSSP